MYACVWYINKYVFMCMYTYVYVENRSMSEVFINCSLSYFWKKGFSLLWYE